MSKQPFVFIFDIDNTIIGNIRYIYQEFQFHQAMELECLVKKPTALKQCNKMIHYESLFNSLLIRPHFIEFINFIKIKFVPCELYLYTGSSYPIIHNFFIQHFEKQTGVKFNRPMFTRNDMIQGQKSILHVLPRIQSSLQEKYQNIDINQIIQSRILFIDDVPNNLFDLKSKQIHCPAYSYAIFYDVFTKLRKIYPKTDLQKIIQISDANGIYHYNPNSHDALLQNEAIYKQRIKLIKMQIHIMNQIYSKDKFFLLFQSMLKTIKDFSDDNIQKLNSKLQNKLSFESINFISYF